MGSSRTAWGLALVAVAALAVITVVMNSGEVDPRRDGSVIVPDVDALPNPPPRTPAPPAPTPPPPLYPPEVIAFDVREPVALELLAVNHFGPIPAVIDLWDAEVAVYGRGTHRLPAGSANQGVAFTANGVVVMWSYEQPVRAMRPGQDGWMFEHEPTLVRTPEGRSSLQVWPTLAGDRLWLTQAGREAHAGRIELVDLASGRVVLETEIPPNHTPAAVTNDGLLLTIWDREDDEGLPLPGGVAELRPDGHLIEVGTGGAWATSGEWIVMSHCFEATAGFGCELDLLNRDTSERHRVARPVAGRWASITHPHLPCCWTSWPAAGPDGRILAAVNVPDPDFDFRVAQSHIVAIDPEAPDEVAVLHHASTEVSAAWSRDGRHVVLFSNHRDPTDAGDLTVIEVDGGFVWTIPNAIPAGHLVVGTR